MNWGIWMIELSISEEDLSMAKQITTKLDSYKTYDKFKCDTNYIGVLGEMILDRYLTEKHIEHDWIKFIKDDLDPSQYFNYPDFKIGDISIDIKTTYSDSLWFQTPKYDIYIHGHVSPDNKILLLSGFVTKDYMYDCIKTGKAKLVRRGNRTDYVISPDDMLPISFLKCIRGN